MKIAQKQDILNMIPTDWKIIKKEDYYRYSVRVPEDFELVAAYETQKDIVIIASYENVDNFLEEYDRQFSLIKSMLNGKDWKTISPINPLSFGYQQIDGLKFYVSVFEAYTTDKAVSVQMFYQGDYVIGFNTSIAKPNVFDLDLLAKTEPVINQIISMFK